MKRLLTVGLTVMFMFTACSSTTASAKPLVNVTKATTAVADVSFKATMAPVIKAQTILQQQQLRQEKALSNKIKIEKAVKKVLKYKGKTWYVFSGSSPRGWDCSGLVRWAYRQAGVTLHHSASSQARSGKVVKSPMVGDVVAFYYRGSRSSFHVGLYIGNGKMIHSYYPGSRTQVASVAGVARENWSQYKYIRVLEMPKVIPLDEQPFGLLGQLAKVEQQ